MYGEMLGKFKIENEVFKVSGAAELLFRLSCWLKRRNRFFVILVFVYLKNCFILNME